MAMDPALTHQGLPPSPGREDAATGTPLRPRSSG